VITAWHLLVVLTSDRVIQRTGRDAEIEADNKLSVFCCKLINVKAHLIFLQSSEASVIANSQDEIYNESSNLPCA
jgi:hypothetical protein